MGDLAWKRRRYVVFPLKALRYSAVALGSSGSGKSETLRRIAYGVRKIYGWQVIHIDAKGNEKRDDEESEDNAARFIATMDAAGARTIKVFPALHYAGWQGSPAELKNRLFAVIDYSESSFYGDVATNALDLALGAPTTPRSSRHFLANLQYKRLQAIYANDPENYRRVLNLDKTLLKQVEMRYQVFFAAMAGQLDGTLDYADADAVYLRVRGFVLRNEAPRLGRFLVADFMHYIAERRRQGVRSLLIIDEFNALRMREETSVLFEQIRDFGGSVIISSQGYAGLGPREYADRILDACSTYILHACSDPFQVSRRAGKRWKLETTWSEDEEGNPRRHHRPKYDWRVPESAVMQQEEGQAYWIYKGRAQQVQTAQVPITGEQVREAWGEIRRQEAMQREFLAVEASRRQEQQAKTLQNQAQPQRTAKPSASKPPVQSAKTSPLRKPPTTGKGQPPPRSVPSSPIAPTSQPVPLQSPLPSPTPRLNDDEPDELE
ncbi:MAG: hypothetical protein WCD86_28135 [Ktedonobacteraceae bacterium]